MRFLVRRVGFLLVALWSALTVNFFIPRLMPGNPAEAMMARFRGHVNPNALHALEVAFGIHTHENLLNSYFAYLGDTFQGKLGISLTYFPLPVGQVIMKALPWSLGLVGITNLPWNVSPR
jgi:peptide/nickel transport system permease protein